MELRLLRYFLAVARENSFTRAAKYLHITQPTLSRQLMDLEEELGQKLLNRETHYITLTPEGMLLRKRAEEILAMVQKTEAEFNSIGENIAGDIYIGGGESEAMNLVADAITELHEAYPDIRYHIYTGVAGDVMERLDNGLLDFGVLLQPVDIARYDSVALPAKDKWGVLMRRDTPLARKAAVCPEDLWELPLIISHQKGDDRQLSQWMGREISELNVVATYNLVFNASLLVDEGLGYALCFDKLIHTEGTGLCFRPFSPPLEAPGYIVWKKYQVFSKAAGRFLQSVQEMISADHHL